MSIFSTLSEQKNEVILGLIANYETTEKLVECLTVSINNPDILAPCLKTICNLTNSSDSKIMLNFVKAGVFDAFYALLLNCDHTI
jgi:hypothetical protein